MLFKQYGTLCECVNDLVRQVLARGEIINAPDWNTKRKELPAVFTITDPYNQSYVPKATICNDISLYSYVEEIINGTMDAAVADGKEAYTYHARMVKPYDQVAYVIEELRRNPGSNRAVITVRLPSDTLTADQPCLQLIQFKIYGGAVHMTTYWRSRDLFKALYMNCFALIKLGVEISEAMQLRLATYSDFSDGLHLYEKDWEKAKSLSGIKEDCIDAEDFWIDRVNPFGTRIGNLWT